MPWPNKEDRETVDNNFEAAKNLSVGQATYLFYKRFLKLWKSNERYNMLHFIGTLRERPEFDTETWELNKQLLFKGFKPSDLKQSRDDAHHQMERMYFDPYEDKKREENGEVDINGR